MKWTLFRFKQWLRAWLEVEAKGDAELAKRHASIKAEHVKTEVHQLQDENAKLVGRVTALETHLRNLSLWMNSLDIERTHIEDGHLPCGCFSVAEHTNSDGRNHSKSLWDRTERWLKWRERERAEILEATHGNTRNAQ